MLHTIMNSEWIHLHCLTRDTSVGFTSHTHLGFIFPCLLVIIGHYLVSYILGEHIPPGEYSLSVNTSV